nr:uncharacterized protein LOC117794607 isoform X1 [Marmota flaviventris]
METVTKRAGSVELLFWSRMLGRTLPPCFPRRQHVRILSFCSRPRRSLLLKKIIHFLIFLTISLRKTYDALDYVVVSSVVCGTQSPSTQSPSTEGRLRSPQRQRTRLNHTQLSREDTVSTYLPACG